MSMLHAWVEDILNVFLLLQINAWLISEFPCKLQEICVSTFKNSQIFYANYQSSFTLNFISIKKCILNINTIIFILYN